VDCNYSVHILRALLIRNTATPDLTENEITSGAEMGSTTTLKPPPKHCVLTSGEWQAISTFKGQAGCVLQISVIQSKGTFQISALGIMDICN